VAAPVYTSQGRGQKAEGKDHSRGSPRLQRQKQGWNHQADDAPPATAHPGPRLPRVDPGRGAGTEGGERGGPRAVSTGAAVVGNGLERLGGRTEFPFGPAAPLPALDPKGPNAGMMLKF